MADDGKILEIIFDGLPDRGGGHSHDSCICQYHSPRDFDVEPWTGYFDSRGKKIYRGDILGAFKGVHDEVDPSYETEVVWHEGGFYCKDEQTVPDSWMPLDIENRAWKRHFIKENIHGVEYND